MRTRKPLTQEQTQEMYDAMEDCSIHTRISSFPSHLSV